MGVLKCFRITHGTAAKNSKNKLFFPKFIFKSKEKSTDGATVLA